MTRMMVIIISATMAFTAYVLFFAKAPAHENMIWGVDFSQMQAEALRLNWKKAYSAMLEDLGVKRIKLHTQWDFVEGKEGSFYFRDIDWQLEQAQKHGAKIIYVVGMKTGRWPECHIPAWAEGLSKEQQQGKILAYVKEVVERYKGNATIEAWQAENEPLFRFGVCPWYDKDFLKQEVALIKSLDSSRPVIISDSGEQSLWLRAADIGDVVGVTMYRKVWVHITDSFGFYLSMPFSPATYWIKAHIVKALFNKPVIGVELQVEPWAHRLFYDVPLDEQAKTMNVAQFKKNVAFAAASGLPKSYLWGVEWWYWLKEDKGQPQMWEEARKVFTAPQ